MPNYDRIKQVQDFESLVLYLQDELDWPIEWQSIEDIVFEYKPEELGLDKKASVKIREIRQLRPLTSNQPWGIFFLDFESKRLPVTVLRKILQRLVIKKRARSSDQASWRMHDLLFISALGEDESRGISFAHFSDNGGGTPVLRTFSWDERETHFHYLQSLHMQRLRWPQGSDVDPDRWREGWSSAFTTEHRKNITQSRDMSKELARLARSIRESLLDIYGNEAKDGPWHKLHESFKTVLIHDLDDRRFADVVAQTVTYGLFSARATGENVLGLKHLEAMVPNTNPFLKELFAEFTRLSGHGKDRIDFDELGVSKLVDTLNSANINSVLADFGRQTGGGQEDPVVHFYESFLRDYDREQKVRRGVFYTPKPVVSFIVRSVHKILQDEFGLKYGLADTTTWGEMAAGDRGIKVPAGVSDNSPFVQILDPATGTGTFLETVIDIVYDTMSEKWRSEGKRESEEIRAAWNEYVPKHLLPRLCGFELMMAPYAVAHLKLGLKLKETGYDFRSSARLQVFLTNTLEEPKDFSGQLFAEFLAHEAQAANLVKRNAPVTVIVGNPPYSGHSWNLTEETRRIVAPYRFVDGVRIREKGALQAEKSIQEDYIKFIRYSEAKIESASAGIIGLVTSHGFLDNPTLRGMRWSLLNSFQVMQFVDLHGNMSRYDRCPDGSVDQNVFDIRKTGAALLFLRRRRAQAKVMQRADVYGLRETVKYPWLLSNDVQTVDWLAIKPDAPDYLLIQADDTLRFEYEACPRVADFMKLHSKGVVTGRDHFVLDFDKPELLRRMVDFATSTDEDDVLVKRYDLNPSDWWSVTKARRSMPSERSMNDYVRPILYRPFDMRWAFYHPSVLMSPRRPVMQHVDAGRANYLLITSRMTKGESFAHITLSRGLAEAILLSSKTSNNAICFPLYLYQHTESPQHSLDTGEERRPNLTKDFELSVTAVTGLGFLQDGRGDLAGTVGPEDTLDYIVAILHAPSYRYRYSEFLSRDFPRIPLTSNKRLFKSLCMLGKELVGLHLMETHAPLITKFQGMGGNSVEKAYYAKPSQDFPLGGVWINNTQFFEGVPEDVWNFHIGGYQVCEKWLKDRRGRTLTAEDIDHYHRIVVALHETIRIMKEIDEVIEAHGGWPLVGSVPAE